MVRTHNRRSYGTPVKRRINLSRVSPPKQKYDSMEMNMCVEQCQQKEKKRTEKDQRRIDAFDRFEQKWKDIEEKGKRVTKKAKTGKKIYKTKKGSYYNKRYKYDGKTKTKRVYI